MKEESRKLAYRFLARRDRTEEEVRRHLKEKGIDPEEIDPVIQDLRVSRYLDDADLCQRLILLKIEKGRGPQRIQRELQERGLVGEEIDFQLKEAYPREREYAVAREQIEKLQRNRRENVDSAKIGRKLSSLGFSTPVIYQVIGDMIDKEMSID